MQILYELDYERDQLVAIQALVLLTFWWDGWNDHRDGYYWSGVAYGIACSLGIHDEKNYRMLAPSLRSLRRRIWWSLVIRDTVSAVGSNRGTRIREGSFNVSPLSSEDFLQEACVTTTTTTTTSQWKIPKETSSQARMASLCLAMAKLCRILSRIMEVAYSSNATGHIGILYPIQENYVPEDSELETSTRLDQLMMCERDLHQWWDEVPRDLLHQSPIPAQVLPDEQPQFVLRGFLSMFYFLCVLCLNRPRVVLRMDLASPTGVHPEESPQAMIRHAARNTSQITMDLYEADLIRHAPGLSLSCIFAFSFHQAHDLKSPDERVRREGCRRLEECKLALGQFVDTHLSAKWGIRFLELTTSRVTHWNCARRRRRAAAAERDLPDARRGQLDHNQGSNHSQSHSDGESSPTAQGKTATSTLDLASGFDATDFGFPFSMQSSRPEQGCPLSTSTGSLWHDEAAVVSYNFPDMWPELFSPLELLTSMEAETKMW